MPVGGTCQGNFHALLVLEGAVPGAPGSILHFYAVGCYNLQHPDTMRLSAAALRGLAQALADTLDGRATLDEIRRRIRRSAAGPARVLRRAADPAPAWRRGGWPLTVADVIAGTAAEYADRVTAWACSVRDTLAEADSR